MGDACWAQPPCALSPNAFRWQCCPSSPVQQPIAHRLISSAQAVEFSSAQAIYFASRLVLAQPCLRTGPHILIPPAEKQYRDYERYTPGGFPHCVSTTTVRYRSVGGEESSSTRHSCRTRAQTWRCLRGSRRRHRLHRRRRWSAVCVVRKGGTVQQSDAQQAHTKREHNSTETWHDVWSGEASQ